MERIHYLPATSARPSSTPRLAEGLREIGSSRETRGNVLFYLATPPDFFGDIVEQLGQTGLTAETGEAWRRVIIEKPFGNSFDSARELNARLRQVLTEQQIYRIDHYLGKETVQNLLVFRFANGIFEPIWNRRYIDNVQITVAETVGVEQRGRYYDQAGALRDMVPNHLFQLLSLIAMEPPSSVRGRGRARREGEGAAGDAAPHPRGGAGADGARPIRGGRRPRASVPAYRAEARVDPQSSTETFVALKLEIDNWRWADVPFYLRTGKRLPTPAHGHHHHLPPPAPPPLPRHRGRGLLAQRPRSPPAARRGDLASASRPRCRGPWSRRASVEMDFNYADHFGRTPSTGYETLLYDCMCGDPTLFQRADSVEDGWSVVTPILDVWKALPAAHLPELRGRHLGTEGGRRAPGPGRPGLAAGPGLIAPSDRSVAALFVCTLATQKFLDAQVPAGVPCRSVPHERVEQPAADGPRTLPPGPCS